MNKYINDALDNTEKILRKMYGTNAKFKDVRPVLKARDALKKRIPMKPKSKNGEPICSACRGEIFLEPIDHNMTTYCIYCGQAIDWTEENNE